MTNPEVDFARFSPETRARLQTYAQRNGLTIQQAAEQMIIWGWENQPGAQEARYAAMHADSSLRWVMGPGAYAYEDARLAFRFAQKAYERGYREPLVTPETADRSEDHA